MLYNLPRMCKWNVYMNDNTPLLTPLLCIYVLYKLSVGGSGITITTLTYRQTIY